jgi:hypothetical protein
LPALDIWNPRVDALMYAFCTRGCDPAGCDPPQGAQIQPTDLGHPVAQRQGELTAPDPLGQAERRVAGLSRLGGDAARA